MTVRIFSEDDCDERRASGPPRAEAFISPYDAYVESMQRFCRADMAFLTERTGKSIAELAEGLELYQDPERYSLRESELLDWFHVSEYMFNRHIPRLFKAAEEAERKYPGRFRRNLALLKQYYPKLSGLSPYDLPIGNTWIPNRVYSELFAEILGLQELPEVRFNEFTGRYTVKFSGPVSRIVDQVKYGTERRGISEALPQLMNGEEVVIRDKIHAGSSLTEKTVRNDRETAALASKLKEFMEQYYLALGDRLRDPEIYEQISLRYCESVGGYYKSSVNCGWVKVPGLDTVLRDYQKNGIGAALLNPATFFAWGTGTGKSLGMLAAASEMKRLKIAEKILFVIPNNSLENFEAEIRKFFPSGNYLIIYPGSFNERKEKYLDTIRSRGAEYDAVVMAVSSYMMLDLSRKKYLENIERELKKVNAALRNECALHRVSQDTGVLKREIKELEKRKKEIQEREERITDCFDTLDIGALFIDECQEFKNVTLKSGYSHITGVSTKGSEKGDRNMEKVHFVLESSKPRSGRVVFATATPLKNSISETYVWQKYLNPEELAFNGIKCFRDWMKAFAETETRPGVAQDLSSMNLQTRVKYHNLTDLHNMMSPFMNYCRPDREVLKLPKKGPYIDVVIPATEAEIRVFGEIAEKLRAWHEGEEGAEDYNPLMAATEGRACSSDIRLLHPEAVPEKGSTKAEAVAAKVYELYRKYPGKTQLVFCDLSVPKQGFNLYDEMKKHMTGLGIPAHEIAFIHDADTPAKKQKLLRDFCSAKVAVLIGSTIKLGTGLNVASKAIACHHLDVTFSSSDLIQRNGRIVRAGNENEEVFLYRYIKERSFDAVSWDRVEMKQGWTEAFNSAGMSERERDSEDLSDNCLSYGEAVACALGKPEMRRYVETDNEYRRTAIEARKRAAELQELQELVRVLPEDIVRRRRYTEAIDRDRSLYESRRRPMTETARRELGEQILERLKLSRAGLQTAGPSFRFQGFQVIVPAQEPGKKPFVKLVSPAGNSYRVETDTDNPSGLCQILGNYLGLQLPKIRNRHEKKREEDERELLRARQEIEKGNPQLLKLTELRAVLAEMEKEFS